MSELSTRTFHTIAAEINSIKDQTRTMVLYNSIEIGRRLTEAKQLMAHGEWGNWLKESVDYSQSTANNLMKIFEQFGDNQLALFGDNVNSQALVNLSYTQAVALLNVPQEEREQFIQDNDVENMSTRELQQAIKENKILSKQLKESEAQAEKERKLHEKTSKAYEALEQQSKAHDELVARLKAELAEAGAAGDNEEVDRLQASLKDSEKELQTSRDRIKELETELKQKPIDVPAVVEKIPEEIERELAELRKKVANPKSHNTVKFGFCFDSVVRGFQDLLGILDEIKESDPEDHTKYHGAVTGLLGKMSERL